MRKERSAVAGRDLIDWTVGDEGVEAVAVSYLCFPRKPLVECCEWMISMVYG